MMLVALLCAAPLALAQDAPERPATSAPASAPAALPPEVSTAAVDLDAPAPAPAAPAVTRKLRLEVDRPRDAACVSAAAEVNATRNRIDELRKALAACKGVFACVEPLRAEILAADRRLETQMRAYDDACLKSGAPLPQKAK